MCNTRNTRNTRTVEFQLCVSGTWLIHPVNIPVETSEDNIEGVARKEIEKELVKKYGKNWRRKVSIVEVYNVPSE